MNSSWYFSSFMTYHRECNRSNATDVISEAGTAYPSRAPEFTEIVTGVTRRVSLVKQQLLTLPEHRSSPPIFCGIRVVFRRSLFVLFRLAIVLYVLWSTASDYPVWYLQAFIIWTQQEHDTWSSTIYSIRSEEELSYHTVHRGRKLYR